MSCLLAKSDAASLTQAFCRGPIKHRVSGARSAALDCATSLSIAQAPVGNVHALGWAERGERNSCLYWVPRAIGLAHRTCSHDHETHIGELMTAGAGFSSYNKVHTSFSHGVPRLPMCYVHGDKRTRFCVKVAGKWRTPLAIALAVSMEPALRQHLRSTTCSAVTASLRA